MSEESKTTDGAHHPQNEKITSVEKVKDPRRVEAGKRLGMISKQAKEKKLAQMRKQEDEQNKASKAENNWFSNVFVSSPFVGIGFVGLVGFVLYYGYNKKYKSLSSNLKDGSQTPNSNPKNEAKPKRVYKELDTLD